MIGRAAISEVTAVMGADFNRMFVRVAGSTGIAHTDTVVDAGRNGGFGYFVTLGMSRRIDNKPNPGIGIKGKDRKTNQKYYGDKFFHCESPIAEYVSIIA